MAPLSRTARRGARAIWTSTLAILALSPNTSAAQQRSAQPTIAQPLAANKAQLRAIDLQSAQQLARKKNERWELLQVRLRRSRAQRREALSAMLPQLTARGSGTRLGSEIAFQGRIIRPQFGWNASATASVALFDGPALQRYFAEDRLVEAQKTDQRYQAALLQLEVARAFYTLQASQREVELAEKIVALRADEIKRAERLRKAGLGLSLDIARAQSKQLESRQTLVEARRARDDASDALAILLGQQPGPASLRAAGAMPKQAPAPPADNQLMAMAKRADFQAAQLQIESLEHSSRANYWGLLPRLTLAADADLGPPTFSNPDGFIWSLTLSASWTLYAGGATWARAIQIETQRREIELQRSNDLRAARAQLARVKRQWTAAQIAKKLANKQVEVAQKTYELAQRKLDAGLANSFDLTEASDTLFRARLQENRSLLAALLARADYQYLLKTTRAR